MPRLLRFPALAALAVLAAALPAAAFDEEAVARLLAAVEAGEPVACPACNFSYANLGGLDLSGADLAGAFFYGARLRGTVLRGAVLDRADFTRADLTAADLTGASMESGAPGQHPPLPHADARRCRRRPPLLTARAACFQIGRPPPGSP